MDAWQAKQQMSTTAMLLPSKRTQTIQEKGLLIAFFPTEKVHMQKFQGIQRRGSLVPLREMELWAGAEKER